MVARHQVSGTFQRKKHLKSLVLLSFDLPTPLVHVNGLIGIAPTKEAVPARGTCLSASGGGKKWPSQNPLVFNHFQNPPKTPCFRGKFALQNSLHPSILKNFREKMILPKGRPQQSYPIQEPGIVAWCCYRHPDLSYLSERAGTLGGFCGPFGKNPGFFSGGKGDFGGCKQDRGLDASWANHLMILMVEGARILGSPQIESLWSLGCLDVSS